MAPPGLGLGEGATGSEDEGEPQAAVVVLMDGEKVKNSEGENLLEMLVLYYVKFILWFFMVFRFSNILRDIS